jgi:hypothetical protein
MTSTPSSAVMSAFPAPEWMLGLAAAGFATGSTLVSVGAFESLASFFPAKAGATNTSTNRALLMHRFTFGMIGISSSREQFHLRMRSGPKDTASSCHGTKRSAFAAASRPRFQFLTSTTASNFLEGNGM